MKNILRLRNRNIKNISTDVRLKLQLKFEVAVSKFI